MLFLKLHETGHIARGHVNLGCSTPFKTAQYDEKDADCWATRQLSSQKGRNAVNEAARYIQLTGGPRGNGYESGTTRAAYMRALCAGWT